jgi:hypothetical protein
MSAILVRQARRWKAQELSGDLPDELYEALADGRSSHFERRIIRNLAKISTIISDEGSIRPYSDFSSDWNYTKSLYGHTHKCELCGHAPIVENCVLTNDDGREIMIGNVCVHRYVEIRDESGRVLNTQEKAQFLKTNMKEAKVEHAKQEFTMMYPNAMFDLKRYEALMRTRKKWKTLHKTVVRRLATVGYLGQKTRRQWDEFMSVAEKEQKAYDAYKEQKALEKQAQMTLDSDRKIAFQQRLAEKRNQFTHEGQEWIEQAMEIESNLNAWEKKMVGRVLEKIKVSGVEGLGGGFGRFREEVLIRRRLDSGEVIPLPPIAQSLLKKQAEGELNEWESGFVDSVIGRLAEGRSLSDAQMGVVNRIIGDGQRDE